MIFIGNHLRLIEIGRGPEVSFGACVDDARLSRCINAMHLEDVLGDIQTDCANLRVDDPSDVVRCQRSPSGTSMPREGVVHYIRFGCEQLQHRTSGYAPGSSFICSDIQLTVI